MTNKTFKTAAPEVETPVVEAPEVETPVIAEGTIALHSGTEVVDNTVAPEVPEVPAEATETDLGGGTIMVSYT